MAVTTTYGWTLPTNGADAGTWGTELNGTIQAIDTQMALAAPLASPALTGLPTAPNYATTAASGVARGFGHQTAGVYRWNITATATAESGSNVGSDFTIDRFNDAGTFVDSPLTINRATGNITVAKALTVTGALGLAAGQALAWNGDAGIFRAGAASLLVGNGTNGDQTGTLAAAKFSTSSNANITSPGSGIMQVGTGTTTGAGGTLNAANFNGAIGSTTPAAGAFTTVSASSTLTVTGLASLNGGANVTPAATPANNAVGYLGIPVNEQDGNYTLVMADAGKMVRANSASGIAYTIPPSGSVAYPVGTTIVVRNIGAGAVTITRGAGVVLWKVGSGTDANVTLAQYGMATMILESSNWVISGTGIS